MSKLKKIAKYACGGKMPKHLYGGRIATHKDELEKGGPIEPPGVSLKRRPGSKKFSAMSDEELIELAKEYHNTANSYQRELDSLQARSGRKGKTKPTAADNLRYSAIELLFGDSSLKEWDMSQFEKNKKARSASVNPEGYMLPQGTAKESTRVSRLLELAKGGPIHIKPSKKGTFTAAATKHGKGVQEFARQVLANKGNYSSAMVKKANFARNSKSWNKDFGGFLQDIAPLLSMIPGAGMPISTGAGLLGQFVSGIQDNSNSRLYGVNQMKLGGDFKQYSAPSHASGGQLIDANGNPTMNMPVAEIEKGENSHDGYVYSDTLVNPDTGNTFAKDAKKVANKTKRQDDISKSSRILQLMKLRQSNEMLRQTQEQTVQPIPEAVFGIPFRQDRLFPILDLSIPSSVSPGILPIYNNLPTRGGISASPREYPYNRDMMRESVPQDEFYTVTGDSQLPGNQPAGAATTGLNTLNKVAAGLKGASLAFGAYDALRGSEQEQLQLPDYSKGDQYFRGLEIDLAPALNEINMGATKAVQDTSNQAGGIGARNSRVNAILSRAGKNAASVQLQQQQANAGIRAQIGSREDMKSQTTANERVRQQIAQSQNDATNRLAGRKFFSDLSQVGSTLNNIQYMNDVMKNQNELGQQSIQYGLAVLANKYPNFKPDPAFMERLRTSTLTDADKPIIDELIKFYRGG
jgi:hypothetical protein